MHFLKKICKHLLFVFRRQTNFEKFAGNQLCQSLIFIKGKGKIDPREAVFLQILIEI